MRTMKLCYAVLLPLLFLAADSSMAQVTWMQPYNGSCVSAEYRDAVGLDDEGNDGFAFLLNGRYRFSPTLQSLFQMPMSFANVADYYLYSGGSSVCIGNPYFGIEYGYMNQSSGIFQAGMRLPTGSANSFEEFLAASYGVTLVYEQFEAYYPEMLSIHGAGGYRSICMKNNVVRCQWETLVGATFMKPEDVDGELFCDVNSTLWLHTTRFSFGFGGIMRGILTEDVDNLGDRFNIQGGASVVGVFGQFRPLISVTVPFSDFLSEQYAFTISAGLGIDFGGNEATSENGEL